MQLSILVFLLCIMTLPLGAEQNFGITLPGGYHLNGYLGTVGTGKMYHQTKYGEWGTINGDWGMTNRADGYFTISGTNLLANPYPKMAVSVFHETSGVGIKYFQEGPGFFEYTIFFKLNQGSYRITLLAGPDDKGVWIRMAKFYIININTNNLSYLVPSYWVQSLDPAIIKQVQEITMGLSMEKEKVLAIHDWVAKHCSYHSDPDSEDTALQVLQTGKAVCRGYSSLTAALCRAIGIPAKCILGVKKENGVTKSIHGWNEVYYDGAWHIVDVTKDDPVLSKSGHNDYPDGKNIKHKYFDPDRGEYCNQYAKTVDIIQK
ncbi:MAG: hypothetical protein A2Y33_09330 [Spirochaetes bacterium GWF1_51_8]|nr:MAG: hypothetical protein A2Y33_09330 [Spirochaetes bacterium GWF1_51_8]